MILTGIFCWGPNINCINAFFFFIHVYKHTSMNAMKYSLVGWVMNTTRNTVVGQIQGDTANVRLM